MYNDQYSYTIPVYDSDDQYFVDVYRLQNQLHDDCFATQIKFNISIRFTDLVETICERLREVATIDRAVYQFNASSNCYIHAFDRGNRNVISIRLDDHYRPNHPSDKVQREFSVRIAGLRVHCEYVYDLLLPHKGNKLPRVVWHYSSGGRSTFKPIMLSKPKPALDVFYPFLTDKGGVKGYIKSYLESDSNILIMLGRPGTGKTSLVRNLIYDNKLNTSVTYDEDLLSSDGFFVNFLTDDDTHLMVVEDADLILTDRENSGNKVMSKLLNVSDGLIRVLDKKMIFTANITDPTTIDAAITRPGRCFDVITFPALTFAQARAAAEEVGLPVPEEDRDYTLAELFDQDDSVRNTDTAKPSFGFI